MIECDLTYPEYLHDSHNDYPLCAEHLIIDGFKKLAPNFNDKKNYIVHIANLQFLFSQKSIG